MASSSTSSTLDSSDEILYGTKLMRLILDGGTEALRIVFKRIHPGSLQVTLCSNQTTLSKLKRLNVLKQIQWDTLYPIPPRLPSISDFDITLLSVLLRNISSLTPPSSGWDNMPNILDYSVEADVVRIKLFRNQCFGHKTKTAISATNFKKIWEEIKLPLIRLGVDQGEIDRLHNEKCGSDEIARVLKEWNDFDEKIFCTLENMETKLSENNNILKGVKSDVEKLGQHQFQSSSVLTKFLVHFDFKREIQFYLSRYVIGTRRWVLEQVTEWFHDENSKHRAFVISSLAGMGKSVVAAVICDRFEKNVAYCHFIQYNNSQYNNPNFLLQSLAWHLCQVFPAYKLALVEKLSGNLGRPLNEMDIEGVFTTLLKDILTDIENPERRLLIVLDAVDESEYCGRQELANLIANHFHKLPAYIRFVITARPEKKLLDKFSKLNPFFIEVDDERNLNDIKLVIQNNLPRACEPDVQTCLAEKCGGSMLYAYFLTEMYKNESFDERQTSLPCGIDEYYEKYLQRLERELGSLEISNDQFLSLLSALAVAQQPIPEAFVGSLFQFESRLGTKQKVRNTVNSISSLFLIQEDKSISFFHKSVRDWLVNSDEHDYTIDVRDSHDVLFCLCVEELDKLKEQSVICELPTSSVALRYALKHCIVHLLKGNLDKKSMECFVTDYVTDLQVMFAGVSFNIDLTLNNIFMLTKHDCFHHVSEGTKITLNKLIWFLRKSGFILRNYPQTFLQNVVNEGGEELSLKASILLETRYKNSVYLECFNKHQKSDIFDICCHLSGKIWSVDISPNHDYIICIYFDDEIELFSLTTGRSEWRKKISLPLPFYRLTWASFGCYRVVFHPNKQLILPGKLDKVLTFQGTITTGPFQTDENASEFIGCCFTSDGGKMATFHANEFSESCMLMVWNVFSGAKEFCLSCGFLTSISFTASGNFLGATGDSGKFIIYDVAKDYEVKSRMIIENDMYDCLKIISPFDQNSWLCYYSNSYFPDHFSQVKVLNSDFSGLDCYSLCLRNVHLPSTPHVCNKLQSFVENYDESWFSRTTTQIRSAFGWPYDAVVSYLLMDEKNLAVFSSKCNTIYIVGLESLANTKTRVSKKTCGFSAISNNGDVVYLSGNERKGFAIHHVRLENRYLKFYNEIKLIYLIVVRNGVVLSKNDRTLEHWNNDLTELFSSFHELAGARKCLPVSEEIIACVFWNRIVFFNVFTKEIRYKIHFNRPVRSVRACSVRYHVVIHESDKVSLLKKNTEVELCHEIFKENALPGSKKYIPTLFSPKGDRLVLSGGLEENILYIFDVDTIQFLGQIPIYGLPSDVPRLRFFGNEKLVCCLNSMTYFIEIGRVQILTCLDVGDIPESISVCQERQTICLGYESSEMFEMLRICCQR